MTKRYIHFLFLLLLLTSCKAKSPAKQETSENTAAQSFMRSQSAKSTEKTALDRISYNKALALTDTGSKHFTDCKAKDITKPPAK